MSQGTSHRRVLTAQPIACSPRHLSPLTQGVQTAAPRSRTQHSTIQGLTNPPLFPAPSRCRHHQRSLQQPLLRVYSNWRTRTVSRGGAAWPGSPEVSPARCAAVGTSASLSRSSRWHGAARQPSPQLLRCPVPRRGKQAPAAGGSRHPEGKTPHEHPGPGKFPSGR